MYTVHCQAIVSLVNSSLFNDVDCIGDSNLAGEPLQDKGQPVDDVEDEEQNGKRFQEKLVNSEIENYTEYTVKITQIEIVNQ